MTSPYTIDRQARDEAEAIEARREHAQRYGTECAREWKTAERFVWWRTYPGVRVRDNETGEEQSFEETEFGAIGAWQWDMSQRS